MQLSWMESIRSGHRLSTISMSGGDVAGRPRKQSPLGEVVSPQWLKPPDCQTVQFALASPRYVPTSSCLQDINDAGGQEGSQ